MTENENSLEAEIDAAAQRIAEDEVRWARRAKLLSWDTAHLQATLGKSQAEISRLLEVCHSMLSRKVRPAYWVNITRAMTPWIATLVRRAMTRRRALKFLPADDASDDAHCAIFGFGPDEPRSVPSVEAIRAFAPLPPAPPEPVPGERWEDHAHEAQLAPEGAWRTWLLMGGRGAGKTRAGAEWVRGLVESGIAKRIALVGPSLHDVREVMIDGPSGLCAIGDPALRPTYEVSRRRLVWPPIGNGAGAVAFAFSAEDPDSLRGPQFDLAWCDEIGAWANDLKTWNTLAFGMRLGPAPRIVATTTPRPRALVKMLAEKAERKRGGVVISRAATRANAANLAPEFVAGLEEDYAGTELGRQELDGELIEDLEGALWSRAMIEAARAGVDAAEGLERVVVAVDPPVTATGRSDACGIIVAGVKDGVVFVLEDATVRGLKPAAWAARVMLAAQGWGAGTVVAESNQGGEMVRDVLDRAGMELVDPDSKSGGARLRVKLQHAHTSKRERAAPVSVLYTTGRVRHVRVLKELEDEMCSFGAPGDDGRRARSPDRVDALVWAVDELTAKRARPKAEQL